MTELMGNEIFVYLQVGDSTFIARIDPRADVRAGDEVDMAFNIDKIHIFDATTEKNIATPAD